MNKFLNNINRFPMFLISVITGFFLTTFYTIFELLKKKNKRVNISIIMLIFTGTIIVILRQMLGIN
uniref:Uncharacterized protein ycf33 n=1 Tax=Gracilaria vermiculophylla TaxID=2608709 RepID=A0A345U968_9FLOR|nr:hypothetical protein [Gracilaria vermiculophylla]AXI97004.1 hypothetical protein [Gracilaria vermiculophylla]QXU75208.1 hypothetical protein [Gracilaria vermiculophylla]WDZ68051.1 hypothetical protein [Gracilaria vermiculophylla]